MDRNTPPWRTHVRALLSAMLFVGTYLVPAHGALAPSDPTPPTDASPVSVAVTDALVLAAADARQGQPGRDAQGQLLARPGDVIEYMLTARNDGTDPAFGVEMVNRVPPGTHYVGGSALGARTVIAFSIDGGATFGGEPIQTTERRADGSIGKRTAEPSEYTHVKWVLQGALPPQQQARAVFRVQVDQAVPPVAPPPAATVPRR